MISVIIPTYNAEKFLEKLFISLESQTVTCEVIIVDSSSSDNTVHIAKSCGAMVISIKKEDFNHGLVRNMGAKHAKGDVFVFMTQDALPFEAYAIEKLIEPLGVFKKNNAHDIIGASYGRQIPHESAKPIERFARVYNYPDMPSVKCKGDIEKSDIKTFFFSNVFSAVRKDVFESVGGFPEDLYMFEDMLFAAKLMQRGYKIAYVSDAKVIHSHNLSCFEQFKRYFFAGISFKKNRWFLELSKAEGEGLNFLKEELRYLIRHHAYPWLIYALIEAVFKYAGYKIGTNYDKIPFLKRKF
ncbi:MAG: glycosyltransferase [Syntrophorhabdaceae bacterium]|nr:glycosyltransferase [Syntrophorhabdaceae bacterium]